MQLNGDKFRLRLAAKKPPQTLQNLKTFSVEQENAKIGEYGERH